MSGFALVAAWPLINWQAWPVMLALLLLAIGARRLAFNLGKLAGVSFDTPVHFATIALTSPIAGALVAGVSAILGLLFHPKIKAYPMRHRLLTLSRNGGMFILMQLGSGMIYRAALGGTHSIYGASSWQLWALALLWIVAYHLINALIGYPMYLLSRQVTLVSVLKQDPKVFLAELATLPAGVLLVAIYRAEGLGGLIVLGGGLIAVSAMVQRLANTSQRLSAQLKASHSLTQVGQALSALLDAEQVIDLIYQHAMQIMNTRNLSIAIYDPIQQLVHYPLVVEDGKRYPTKSTPFESEAGLTEHIINSRRPLCLNTSEEISRLPARTIATGTGVHMQSYLGVPMVARDNVIGVVSVQSRLRDAFTEDDLHTLATLAQQAAISIDNSRLVRDLAVRERMKQELEIARRTQLSLLPQSAPSMPGLDIAGVSMPAIEVGGDFYSYHTTPHYLSIAIGDVSGKGMPAALLMALSAGFIEAEAPRVASPAVMLANADRALRPHAIRSHLNVACCYVLASHNCPNNPTFRIASAGMPSPIVRHTNGQVAWLDTCGLPLGIPDVQPEYAEIVQPLLPGEVMVLASDGIIEAHTPHGEMFGFDRFEATVAAAPVEQGAQAIIDFMISQMQSFIRPGTPQDDVTLVVIRAI